VAEFDHFGDLILMTLTAAAVRRSRIRDWQIKEGRIIGGVMTHPSNKWMQAAGAGRPPLKGETTNGDSQRRLPAETLVAVMMLVGRRTQPLENRIADRAAPPTVGELRAPTNFAITTSSPLSTFGRPNFPRSQISYFFRLCATFRYSAE